jgi:hypothetical protein
VPTATRPGLPTGAEVRALAAGLVTDELIVVPVRHHSPACAHAVRAAFERRTPSAVLIEGPRSFTPLLPLLDHPEARFPLAIYTYARRTARSGRSAEAVGGYYPFCDYSPELEATRLAHRHDVPVTFCDLELAEQLAVGSPRRAGDSLLEERHFEHSRALQALAEAQGCRDHEDLWELLFEADREPAPLEEHVARMAAYCLLSRRSYDDEDLAADGTTAREAEMAFHVREALAARKPGEGPVLVVLGGFHAVALPDLLAAGGSRPEIDLDGVEVDAALIRFSFERLDRLNGYASGMTSPGWHQRIWEQRERGATPAAARESAALTSLLDLAGQLRRRHRTHVSTPSLAAAHQQLTLLTRLRERPAPLRSDLLDAITSCLVQGEADTDGLLVHRVARDVLCGEAFGTLPPGTGTPPLVEDTLRRLRAQRLSVDDSEARNVNLDLYRNPGHRVTSRLLHGLVLLGVPFALHVGGPDFVRGIGLARLQERWTCTWSPLSEGALVEASMYGATFPEAVATCLDQLAAEVTADGRVPTSAEAASLLARTAVLGLHDRSPRAAALVRDALGHDPDFLSVTRTAGSLALLVEGREPLEATKLTELPELLAAAYARAIFLGRELQGEQSPPLEAADALSRLRELLASPAGAGLDPDPYWAMVEHLRTRHDVPLMRGAATGLAFAAGRIDAGTVGRDVAGQLSGSVPPGEAVGFVRGLLLTAREATWQDTEVLPTLNERLQSWDDATFLAHLPELRLAFASLTPRETDRVAELVARLHGGMAIDTSVRRDVDEGRIAELLAVSVRVSELLRRDGLEEWVG